MKGHSIAGKSAWRKRIDNDYYATAPESIKALLEVEEIIYPALEPACGEGHISKFLNMEATCSGDLINRGFGNYFGDFLADTEIDLWQDWLNDFGLNEKIQTVITNPPFNLFQEFVEKALTVAEKKVIMFGKLQALEGKKRATFLEKSPLKTVYVFKTRQNPLPNGSTLDEKGKPWASTMAFAWYVWEIGYTGEPVIKWI